VHPHTTVIVIRQNMMWPIASDGVAWSVGLSVHVCLLNRSRCRLGVDAHRSKNMY